MSDRSPVWRVGTSGWQYRDWRGAFYPDRLPQRGWLGHYADGFDTVEVNSAFYRLPARGAFEAWAAATPPGFLMAVKASRFLTHVRRLREPAEPVARLMASAIGLGDKLGPVLLQLPPHFAAEPARLDETLACFPAGVRVAVEPRDPSWWTAAVYGVLVSRGAALVWADRGGRLENPPWVTASWGYVRLHHGRTRWEYGAVALRNRAAHWLDTFPAGGYAYCNNDPGAAAVRDAQRLQRILTGPEMRTDRP